MRGRLAFFLCLGGALVALSGQVTGQADATVSGAAVYEENCEMCHDVGGVGIEEVSPPLVDNPRILDTAYLTRVIREGISGPIEVGGQAFDDEMDGLPDLPDAEFDALVAYIQGGFVGAAEEIAAPAPQEQKKGDPGRGDALFAGRQPLENGGPACVACHSAGAYRHLGGRGLGPDLTKLRGRVAGDKGLVAALRKPPSKVMRPLYADGELTEQEVADLAALLTRTAGQEALGGPDWLLVMGLAGALALFGLMAATASLALRRSYARTLRDSR